MKCPEFHELMSLMDGELTEARADELRKHLEVCPDCVALLESQDGIERVWRESFRYPPGETFREMEERIAWDMAARRRSRRRWNILIPAAAAAVVALLGVRLMLFGGPGLSSDLPPGIDAANPGVERGFQVSEQMNMDADAVESALHSIPAVLEEPEELQETEEVLLTTAGEVEDQLSELARDQQDDMATLGSVALDESGGSMSGTSPGALPYRTHLDDTAPEGTLDGLLGGAYGSSGDTINQDTNSQDDLSASADQWFGSPEMISLEEGDVQVHTSSGGSASCGGVGAGSAGGGGSGVARTVEMTVTSDTEEETSSDVLLSTGYSCSDIDNEEAVEEEEEIRSTTVFSSTETADVPVMISAGGDENGEVEGVVDLVTDSSIQSVFSLDRDESMNAGMVCQAEVSDDGGAEADSMLVLTFDSLGWPDPLSSTILDSLFPDWNLYIPFAFRDTVLIVAPGEVRSRLAGDDPPAGAE